MFERFTERARRIVILAREEAGRLRHGEINAAHFTLALIRDGENAGLHALQRLGIDLDALTREVEADLMGTSRLAGFTDLVPFAPDASRALRVAAQEADRNGRLEVRSDDLLMAIIMGGTAPPAGILKAMGISISEMRHEIRALTVEAADGRPS